MNEALRREVGQLLLARQFKVLEQIQTLIVKHGHGKKLAQESSQQAGADLGTLSIDSSKAAEVLARGTCVMSEALR